MPLILVLLLGIVMTSCGGGQRKPPVIENPYASRAQDFINNGKTALQQERWQLAEQSFSRALMTAQLADNTPLIGQSWYNMGVARAAMGHSQKAEAAYNRAIRLAQQHDYDEMQMRARLALSLLRLRSNSQLSINVPDELFDRKKWPADIYLQAARLMQLQKQSELAKHAYMAVLSIRGKGAIALKMQAQAHMGLALLAKAGGKFTEAKRQADKALTLCHRIGAARLTAHVLLLKGQLPGQPGSDERRDQLERALDIYTVLKDKRGRKQSLIQLGKLAKDAGDQQAFKRVELRLNELIDKLEQ